ncbi:glycoside hydrolase [Pilobolus umbonatus]|nr:glycoside hydrolase [Pilobolus umbonatus]
MIYFKHPHRLYKQWKIILILNLIMLFIFINYYNDGYLFNKVYDEYIDKHDPVMILTNPILGYDTFQSKLPQIQLREKDMSQYEATMKMNRRMAVKKAFLYGWNGYKSMALGHDELQPLTNRPSNPFGGFGATLVDSLSTMLVMELHDEFDQVLPLIDKIDFNKNMSISVFETIIRYLGGLLSAYELSEHPDRDILLTKAEELGNVLLPAFDTPFGLPFHKFNPVLKRAQSNITYLADISTLQLEFTTLSHHTGNPIFASKAQNITNFLDQSNNRNQSHIQGLFPFSINIEKGYYNNNIITFGAMGDSAYEYFLKEYILLDGKHPQYAKMYLQAIESMKKHMLTQLPGYKLLFLSEFDVYQKKARTTMDHLTCFVPGMLAIGSKVFNRTDDLELAKKLMDTCVFMYRSSSTGLSPETWMFLRAEPYNPLTFGVSKNTTDDMVDTILRLDYTQQQPSSLPLGLVGTDRRYLLRPETVESLFMLYRITGDSKYQEYGWEIFKAIQNTCTTPYAFASIKNVYGRPEMNASNQIDNMESFFFAETFKYLYLLFSPFDVISLDKFVFNTEAHPFLRRP